MIIRHYNVIHQYNERRQLTPAGRFWASYVFVLFLVVAWVLW